MADAEGKEQKEEPKKIVHTYPLVRVSHFAIKPNVRYWFFFPCLSAFRYARGNEDGNDGTRRHSLWKVLGEQWGIRIIFLTHN